MHIEVTSPFPLAALPRVWNWMQTFRGRVSDDFGPQTLDAFVEAMLSSWGSMKTWAVYGDGEMGGMISFQRTNPWVGTAHCIFKPDFHGKNLARNACRIAIPEMLSDGIGKVSFYVVGRNLAMGSMLIQLGAKNEGSLRGQTLSGGKPTAINVYGLLKEEFVHAGDHASDAVPEGGPAAGLGVAAAIPGA